MAIDHCDNWSIYGGPGYENNLLNGVYASRGGFGISTFATDPDGISPGYVLHYDGGANNGYNENLRYIYSASSHVAGKAMRQWLSVVPGISAAYPYLASFRDSGNNVIAEVGINTVGGLVFYNRVAGTSQATTGPVITATAWWHIECKIDTTANTFEIRVEGRSVLLATGQNFGGALIAQEAFATQNGAGSYWGGNAYAKDLVYWNGLGTQNIDFLGSVIVTSLLPDADINFTWTPTPGATPGYQILAHSPPQDGVSYLDAPHPSPAPYVCSMPNLSGDITSIKAVMSMVRAAKTDGGDGSLQVGVISTAVAPSATGLGANRPITTAQTYWRDMFEVDPKTGVAWLPSAVSAINLQLNRTT